MTSDFYRSCVEGCDSRYSDDPYARKRCFEWCEEVLDKVLEYQYQRERVVEGGGAQYSAPVGEAREPPQQCRVRAGDLAVLEYIAKKRKYALGVTAPSFVSHMVEAVESYLEEARRGGCAVDEALKRYIADRIAAIFKEFGLNVRAEAISDLHGLPKDVVDVIEMLVGAPPRIVAPVEVSPQRPPEPPCELSAGDMDVLEYIAKKKRSLYVTPLTFTSHMTFAISRYLEEAKERGCAVDETLKRRIAGRIRELFRANGLDVGAESASDLRGIPQDVVDVLKLLGVVGPEATYEAEAPKQLGMAYRPATQPSSLRADQKPQSAGPMQTRYQGGSATASTSGGYSRGGGAAYIYRRPARRGRRATVVAALFLVIILGLVGGWLYYAENRSAQTTAYTYIVSTGTTPYVMQTTTAQATTTMQTVTAQATIATQTTTAQATTAQTTTTETSQSAPIDPTWVQQFIGQVNQYRAQEGAPPLQHCPWLDNFAQIRFATMQTNIDVSHYGFDQDYSEYLGMYRGLVVGEEALFPDRYTPDSYVEYMQAKAPIHWQGLLNSRYGYYGYYIGRGFGFAVTNTCPITEIPGPGIDIPQYYQEYGCQYTIENMTWLVVEMSNYCYQASQSYEFMPEVLYQNQYIYATLNVTQYMSNAMLDIIVQSTYPVKVFLMTPSQYSYWQSLSQQQAEVFNGPALYSAYGTYVTITNYQLSPGTYYLVVSNVLPNAQPTTVSISGNITYNINPEIP